MAIFTIIFPILIVQMVTNIIIKICPN